MADIRRRIAAGEWPPGHKLPSTKDMAELYNVGSQSTVRQAITILIETGELYGPPRARRLRFGVIPFARCCASVSLLDSPGLCRCFRSSFGVPAAPRLGASTRRLRRPTGGSRLMS
ncbi:GntR family transcriptional regulator [Micromonospora sp. NPDC005710]|uniref:GntR family transcriptional regulator n=1 Tax=Micromonospora sp. NPDC005710 TaxID=3157051 RepID=UPI0033CCE098